MITNKQAGVTVSAVSAEIESLDAVFKKNKRALDSQRRFLVDIKNRQAMIVQPFDPGDATVESTDSEITLLKKKYQMRRRRLNALLAVLKDEAEEADRRANTTLLRD